MKALTVFVTLLLLQQTAFAKKTGFPDEADYVVPTTADLVDYSRFTIKIHESYKGSTTDTIAYEFPADLVGIENKVVKFTRVPGTNNWEAPEMTATCTEYGEMFSCNMYLVKTEEVSSMKVTKSDFTAKAAFGCGGPIKMVSFVDQTNVENFLKGAGFTGDVFDKKLAVSKAFACSEPAGILSYEFK